MEYFCIRLDVRRNLEMFANIQTGSPSITTATYQLLKGEKSKLHGIDFHK